MVNEGVIPVNCNPAFQPRKKKKGREEKKEKGETNFNYSETLAPSLDVPEPATAIR